MIELLEKKIVRKASQLNECNRMILFETIKTRYTKN